MTLIQEAGPLGYMILGVGGLGAVVCLLLAVLGMVKRRVPVSVWILLPLVVAGVGAMATWTGISTAIDAMLQASPDTRIAVAMGGLSDALGADQLGRWVAAALFSLSAWGAGLGATVGTGPDKRWTVGAALTAILLTVLGSVGCGVLVYTKGMPAQTWWIVGLLGFGGIGVAVGSFRRALEEHAFRVAAMRFASGISLILSLSYAGKAMRVAGDIALYEAIASGLPLAQIDGTILEAAATNQLAWIAYGVAFFVALCGFLAELGDVVQKGTLFDIVGAIILLVLLGGVRQIENQRVGEMYAIATLSPIQEIFANSDPGWPTPLDLVSTATKVDGTMYYGTFVDPYFGDVVAMHKGEWVRTHRWTGTTWEADGAKIDEVEFTPEPAVLIVANGGDPAPAVFDLLAKTGGNAALLVRTAEYNEDAPPETLPMQLAMFPLEPPRARDLGTELWALGHNQELRRGPTRYWGEGAGERSLVVRLDQAIEASGSPGLHVVITERSRVKDIIDGCVSVQFAKDGEGIVPTDKWCSLTTDPVETLQAEAEAAWVAPETTHVTMWLKVDKGDVDAEAVERMIGWELGAFDECIGAFKEGEAKGRMSMTLPITPRGRIDEVGTGRRNQVESESAWDCVSKRLFKLRFPEYESEENSEVSMILTYR